MNISILLLTAQEDEKIEGFPWPFFFREKATIHKKSKAAKVKDLAEKHLSLPHKIEREPADFFVSSFSAGFCMKIEAEDACRLACASGCPPPKK